MTRYVVKQGDSLLSIAIAAGIADWKTIYDAPNNAALRSKCERGERDPNILFPGEQIFLPNRELKHQPAATDAKHTDRVPRPPKTKLRIALETPEGFMSDEPMGTGDRRQQVQRHDRRGRRHRGRDSGRSA
jgi:hypothetical protein